MKDVRPAGNDRTAGISPAHRQVTIPPRAYAQAREQIRQRKLAAGRKRRQACRRFCVMLLVVVLSINLSDPAAAWMREVFSAQKDQQRLETSPAPMQPEAAVAAALNPDFSPEWLYSSAALLMSLDDGTILLRKNAKTQIYPASLTKMMTVLVALENRAALPERIVLQPEIFPDLYRARATRAGFPEGDEVAVMDLIYGAMLPSGGECCVALANALCRSEADFAGLMNEKAEALGMADTHFANSTGLHDPLHYSTVFDLTRLLYHALQNSEFRNIFTTREYTTGPTAMRPGGITFQSNVFKRMPRSEFPGGRILGGKTGYTGEAGKCLATLAEKNGRHYIFISVGNGVLTGGEYHIRDALNIYQYAIL